MEETLPVGSTHVYDKGSIPILVTSDQKID